MFCSYIRNFFVFRSRGYTLIELLIVISIMAIFVTVGALNFSGYQARRDVQLTAQMLAAGLRDAQSRSLTGEGGLSWGVHLSSSPNGFNIFSYQTGDPCAPGVKENFVQISSLVGLTVTNPVGMVDICFAPTTGFWIDNNPGDGVSHVTIQIDRSGLSSVVFTVQRNGQITY